MALLHDNLDNRELANALYIKCVSAPLRLALHCSSRRRRYYNICVQLKVVSGQALALNSLGINKFLSGDLQLANEMFQVKRPHLSPSSFPTSPLLPPLPASFGNC